ncbi:MAG: hypothetical protein LH479_13975 [Polaromonas sp.]|nr:hypothetical protein [Polaromonas sp.]
MKTTLIALTAMLMLSACPDTKVPKAPPKVPEPKAALQTQMELPMPDRPGQSWIVERVRQPAWPSL